jgi:hypothetical protein
MPAAEVPPEEAELPPAAAMAEEMIAELEPEPEREFVAAAAAEELPPPPPPPVLEPVPTVPEPLAAVPPELERPAEREREPEPEPEPEPAPQVVELHPGAPREWNLWELERLVRDRAGEDPIRDEEWSFTLMYLREFASADGHLSRDFDGLVRETFAEVLRAPR